MKRRHRLPFGAEVCGDTGVRFRLWAPCAESVDLRLEDAADRLIPLGRLDGGWFELTTREASAGSRYRFRIDGETEVPDPASRFQPLDVHGPSEVVDPCAFDWNDEHWRGRPWEQAAIYELHVGTFTAEGTFQALERKLDYLCDLGVTAVELMPVADFPGRRNWGYDGVLPYAPDSSYGRPEDLKRLVQAAHNKGLMVFLDVVYNHFGPEGNYLRCYAPQFFTDRYHTPWGEGINFDGPESRTVRDFFIHNALYWVQEYHLDGLRLDAVDAIRDESQPDILTELAQAVREESGDDRSGNDRFIHLVLENGDNAASYLPHDRGSRVQAYSAQWNDDIHHALHVLITGESDGYYSDYARHPLEQFARCLTEGFAFQGEYSEFHRAYRGECSAHLPPSAFVSFLQNHDQIGNRAFGERILQLAPPQAVKAAMEILLLAPMPPLLFMGEEFGATSPFLFFCDFSGALAAAVTEGRRNEFARFAKFNSPETRERIPDPSGEETYLRSKVDWTSLAVEPHASWLLLYRSLLSIRQQVVVPHIKSVSCARTMFCYPGRGGLSITWSCADGTLLELAANLGNSTLTSPHRPRGQQFYRSTQATAQAFLQGQLPSLSVVWSVTKSGTD
jgi:maltooligosyltrehalose trehalohydrolase